MTRLFAFSQNATTTVEYINIPVPTVKKITIDLLKGDSALSQLTLSNKFISELETKVSLQDKIIETQQKKEENFQKIIVDLEKKVTIYQGELKTTQKELRKLKAKKTFTNIIGGVIIGTLTYLYITK